MKTDYDTVATSFAKSRRNMKWGEIEYFFSFPDQEDLCDLGCGSGRLLRHYYEYFLRFPQKYIGVDISRELLEIAQKDFPEQRFMHGDLKDISSYIASETQKNIYLIASFHHLETNAEREESLRGIYNVLQKGGRVFMTNWYLESSKNTLKYKKCRIKGSKNEYGSYDYSIKIGDAQRQYHSFCLDELEALSMNSGFKILENRIFDNQRNIVTILEK